MDDLATSALVDGDAEAYVTLAHAVADVRSRRHPVLFGVGGGVAVGKTTTATLVARQLERSGLVVAVLSTDAFLLTNAELAQRGLDLRKGFPDSYDHTALASTLDAIRDGQGAEVPVYSHLTYDRIVGETARIDPEADVVVLEGVNVLQSPAVDRLDLSVYVDADEDHVEAWFRTRFQRLCAAGPDQPGSFYATLAKLDPQQREAVAASAWTTINLVNLREHIAPTRAAATFVLRKAADHRVLGLTPSPG